jgi:outer membrane autotransporter protein
MCYDLTCIWAFARFVFLPVFCFYLIFWRFISMKLDIKKLLLAGTAIVAVGATPLFISPAYAADEISVDADSSGTFDADELASSPFDWQTNTNGTAAAGEATQSRDLRVNSNATVTVQDTDIIGDGTATVAAVVAGADALTFTIDDALNDDAAEAVTISGDVSVGAFTSMNFTITGEDTDATGDVLTVDLNGNINLGTGALAITADGVNANNNVNVSVSGNITAASTTLTGAVSTATLTLDGGTLQTLTGTIDGGVAGDGDIAITGAGATFAGAIGDTNDLNQITISNDGTGSAVTFQGDVGVDNASGIVIGDGGGTADTYTVTFDTAGGAIAASGTVQGAATDTSNVIVSGGNTLTTDAAWGNVTVLDNVTLSGEGTGLTTGATLQATNVNIGAATTLTTGGAVTGAVNLTGAGTLALGNTFGVTGAVDNTSGSAGVGTISGTGAGTTLISGNVGATNSIGAITYNGTGTFDFNGTVAATTITATAAGNLDFAQDVTGNVQFGANAAALLADGADITGSVDNITAADGAGNITIAGSSIVSGSVGATKSLNLITINGVGTSSFGSTVNVDDINFGGAATVNFAGNVTTTNDINFANNAGTINFADNANLTGSIDSTAGANGTVNFAGSSTVSGTLGITTNSLAAINFNGGSGETVTLAGNIRATDIKVAGAGTVQSNGNITGAVDFDADGTLRLADTKDITGAIITSTADTGSLILAGSGSIDAFGTDGTELKSFQILGSSSIVSAGGNFEAAKTTDIGSGTLNVGGTIDVDAGQTLMFDIKGATAAGQMTATGNASVDATAILSIDVVTGDAIANAQSFTLIDGAGGAGVADLTTTILDNSYLVSFAQDTTSDSDLVVVATIGSKAAAATNTNNNAVGTVLDAIGTSANTQIAQLQQNLNTATSQQAVNDILESSIPTVDGGAVVSALSVTNQSLNVIGTRLAEVRNDKVGTGMYAGNGLYGTKVWGQAFGNTATQDERENVAGYDSNSLGLAAGIDTADKLEGMTLGFAGSYAVTNVDSDNANKTETEISSWQVAAYANYDLADTAFLDVMLGYVFNDVESKRHNVAGTSGLTAEGDTTGNQYVARFELGNDYHLKAFNEVVLTPTAMINYIHVDQDAYTESGAGGANLDVDPGDLDVFELGVALEATWMKELSNGGIFEPAVHVGYRNDVIGDKVSASSKFIGGGTTFRTEGSDPVNSTFNVGFGATVYNTNSWEFTGGYDFEYKSEYAAHSGVVKAAYKF